MTEQDGRWTAMRACLAQIGLAELIQQCRHLFKRQSVARTGRRMTCKEYCKPLAPVRWWRLVGQCPECSRQHAERIALRQGGRDRPRQQRALAKRLYVVAGFLE